MGCNRMNCVGLEMNCLGLESGAEGQNRTADTMIFSHVLYQLSYLGALRRGKTFEYSTGRPVSTTRSRVARSRGAVTLSGAVTL